MFLLSVGLHCQGQRERCTPSRAAFTIVELLVVIAIIGMLVALLLPAMSMVREAAHRSSCGNNLRQIAIAFDLHHERNHSYPSGGYDYSTVPAFQNGRPLTVPAQEAGWAYQILPYLDAQNTWQGNGGANDTERALIAIGTPIPIYFCPSRRGPMTVTYSDPNYLDGMLVKHALCDYAAGNLNGTGVIRRGSIVNHSKILDGLTYTLLAGDKRLDVHYLGEPDYEGTGIPMVDDNEGYTAGFDEDTVRSTELPPLPDRTANGWGEERFGSSHSGVFNAVFCDTSVHKISYDIDPSVFKNLGDINDGQVVPSDLFE